MANTAISALSAMAAWAAGDLVPIVDVSDTTQGAGGSTKKTTLQDLMTVFTGSTGMRGDTVTTSKPLLDLAQTWNAAGVTFAGMKINITNTASAAGSLVADFQVGGSSAAYIHKNGYIGVGAGVAPYYMLYMDGTRYIATSSSTALNLGVTGPVLDAANGHVSLQGGLRFQSSYSSTGGNTDTAINRNAAGVLEVNNGTPGTYRDLRARNLRVEPTAVASLVAASTAGEGALAWVTDANSTTPRSTVAGGGANKVLVMSNGTNWLIVA